MKILIMGATGMIGSTFIRVLSANDCWDVYGTVRDENSIELFSKDIAKKLIPRFDISDVDFLIQIFRNIKPDVVINCIGLTKHKAITDNSIAYISLNSLWPHRLAELCKLVDARLIHISTDCVFSGEKGNYSEEDTPDAHDFYGKSKSLGEVGYPHTITLRTSTIGHEFGTQFGLLEWFMSQTGKCKGYRRAVFSGLPTVVLADLIRNYVIPNEELFGLYHVAAKPIDKYTLLKLISKAYKKNIDITLDEELVVDRSLNAKRFNLATGYVAPEWNKLVEMMKRYK